MAVCHPVAGESRGDDQGADGRGGALGTQAGIDPYKDWFAIAARSAVCVRARDAATADRRDIAAGVNQTLASAPAWA